MNREILFRAKRSDTGEWCYGNLIDQSHTFYIFNVNTYLEETAKTDCKDHAVDLWFIEVNPATIGQFTGLHDKNGKKIFEGDRMRRFTGYEFAVELQQYSLGSMNIPTRAVGYEHHPTDEIIGTIHDKP